MVRQDEGGRHSELWCWGLGYSTALLNIHTTLSKLF